jgi:hypothetical protein
MAALSSSACSATLLDESSVGHGDAQVSAIEGPLLAHGLPVIAAGSAKEGQQRFHPKGSVG